MDSAAESEAGKKFRDEDLRVLEARKSFHRKAAWKIPEREYHKSAGFLWKVFDSESFSGVFDWILI